ncbi:FadR/GntR family transcriptional regulator [Terrarubrum flagellatum]|uniref:FadR/GntR family transcriptional regulator n=1 Tax=Terrirubrum flagellatum TaxID=2895980 RepID=UPI0031450E40
MTRAEFRFEPLKMLLPSEEAARRLADAIRAGHFRLGDRFPSERNLAEQLGVSRPTVREAARLLVEAGVIEIKPGSGGGAFVISEHVPFDFLAPRHEMRLGEMFEALELRRLILPWVAQEAASYAQDEDFARMRDAISFGRAELKRVTTKTITRDQAQLIVTASMRFDTAMAKATANGLVIRLMDILLGWVEPLRLMTLQQRSDLERAINIVDECMRALESGERKRLGDVIEARLSILEIALEQQSGRMPRAKRRAFGASKA